MGGNVREAISGTLTSWIWAFTAVMHLMIYFLNLTLASCGWSHRSTVILK